MTSGCAASPRGSSSSIRRPIGTWASSGSASRSPRLSPLYRGQLLVHGLGFSPDHRTLAVVSIGSNSVTFVDTATNAVKHVTYLGRAPHEAFFRPDGREVWMTIRGEEGLRRRAPLGSAHVATQLQLGPPGGGVATTVALFEQGITQVLQAAATGLEPKKSYVLALANEPQGAGPLEPLARFDTNPAGAAIVNTVGPIRQVVAPSQAGTRRYLVIAPASPDGSPGNPVQTQRPTDAGPPVQGRARPAQER